MSRPLAIIGVTPAFIVELAKHTEPIAVQVSEHPLPQDAEVVGVNYDHFRQCFDICLKSEKFADVPEGAEIPRLPLPVFQQLAVTP